MAKRIFFADSREQVLNMMTEKLEKIGFDVLSTTNGKEILRTLNVNNVPNLIVLEGGMADVDMPKICFEIKREKRFNNTPVLVVKEKHIEDKPFLDVGIKEFLTRPCEVSQLIERITGLIPGASRPAGPARPGFPIAKIIMGLILAVFVIILIIGVVIPLFSS